MRMILVFAIALATLPAVPTGAAAFSCNGDLNACLAACRTAGIDREQCTRLIRRQMPQVPQPSNPVIRQGNSKYTPVPQDGGSAQRQGPYVNQQ